MFKSGMGSDTIVKMGRFRTPFVIAGAAIFALGAFALFVQNVRVVLAATAAGNSSNNTSASSTALSNLQSQINAHSAEILQLNAEIAKYESAIQKAGADKKTLQAAINTLDLQRKKVQAQISATQNQIDSIQLQLRQLGSNITSTQSAIEANQAAVGENLRFMQQADASPLIVQFFSSKSITQMWQDVDQTVQLQVAIREKLQELQGQVQQLAYSQASSQQKQATLVSQRATLASQQSSLVQTKQSKANLLAQTNAKESTYEKLLAQAKAELGSFSAFTQNAGGSGLLANQTSCDSWGCYYNQRDAAWGNDPLNGTQYKLKSDGCLITAMAMVFTHYGYRNVTPLTINDNPGNFAAYYPAYLLFTISADGVTATRQKIAAIDPLLAQGTPVIVGINAYGGTHYVVLVSGSKGNYVMRDPYIPNGNDVSFNSHYSMRQIFGIDKVVITG